MATAKLQILDGPQAGEEVVFEDSLLIGRSNAVGLALKDATVSREHARLFHRAGQWFVVDLKSSNGTHVRGKQVTRAELEDGDEVMLGVVRLRFSLLGEDKTPAPAAPPSRERADLEIELPGVPESPVVPAPPASPEQPDRIQPPKALKQPSRSAPAISAVRRLELPSGSSGSRPVPRAGKPGLLGEDLNQWGLLPKSLVVLLVLALGVALFYFTFRFASGV